MKKKKLIKIIGGTVAGILGIVGISYKVLKIKMANVETAVYGVMAVKFSREELHNQQFKYYEGDHVKGSEVKQLIDDVSLITPAYIEETNYMRQVSLLFKDKKNKLIVEFNYNDDNDKLSKMRRLIDSDEFYTVELKYDENDLVNEIVIKQKNNLK